MFGKSFLHLYHIYSPTGNKELTEIWHGLILFWFKELTDCHQEATILRPNDSTLLSSAFIRGESLYPLALRTGGRDLKLDGAQWFHCIEIQMTAVLSNADSVIREPVDPCTTSLTITFLQIRYIKVHTATRWTIGHDLVLLCFKDLMNVTEKLQFIDQRFDTPV